MVRAFDSGSSVVLRYIVLCFLDKIQLHNWVPANLMLGGPIPAEKKYP